MLMIIFGAGASYDSCSEVPVDPREDPRSRPARNRPPLTDGLFNERTWGPEIKKHQDCVALFPRLRGASSVEEELEKIHDEAPKDPSLARAMFQLRHYLRAVINTSSAGWFELTSGVTNYVTLLGDVQAWRKNNETVCLVTLNYDTLLDDACRDRVGLEFRDMASYIEYPSYKLFKLHGSINWGRLVRNVRGALEWTDTYSNDKTLLIAQPETYKPAIAIPTVSKSGFECPPSHVEALKSALPDVTRLLVIGWRGMEKQFLRLWADTHPKAIQRVQIVSGSQRGATHVRDQLARTGVCQRVMGQSYPDGGFSKFLQDNQLRSFLHD